MGREFGAWIFGFRFAWRLLSLRGSLSDSENNEAIKHTSARHCEGFSPKQSTNETFETLANRLLLANLNANNLSIQF
ncbi:hypothetical protein ACWIUD_04740 [Helicobacter sp. 23-1044]